MAGLFKNKIIKEELGKFEIPDFDNKLKIIQNWLNFYENGELAKKTETQCEQAFNQDIFVNVLGYKPFPADVYNIIPKDNVDVKGGQKPDATLGHFEQNNRRVIAVVEIKDVNTPLDKSQRREGNLSPIQQAFKYKPQYEECSFVIATNFIEIRLFRDNQLDFEKFTLSSLINPEDDYFNFRKFYYLLSAQNFVSKQGQTQTEKILANIRIEQEKITNKFYKQYKSLRSDLIRDILKNNPDTRQKEKFLIAVEKSQKIVDRIVFICFLEDSGLLPENKLLEVIGYADKIGVSSWGLMKDFFSAVDKGSEKLDIPDGYNGELFKPDSELDSLIISDDVCNKFAEISKYDFSEDLSVNILGHIFEQSISDLEELKSLSEDELLGKTKKESKRKKEGVYYTPEYIVDYIVRNSLGKYLEDKEQEILSKHHLDDKRLKDKSYNKKLIEAYTEYIEWLKNVKVLDPACGSGAFLVKVFDYLLAEHKRIYSLVNAIEGKTNNSVLLSDDDYVKPILEKNIYGVDLNPESVEITKLSLWLKSAKRGQKLITLKQNIKCGNSLINDPEIAGERAFNWQKEFSDIYENGGFDVIVGNPPYIRPHNLQSIDKKFFWSKYKTFEAKSDIYALFVEKGMELLKRGGNLSYIMPHTWMYLESFKKLRNLILENNLYKLVKTDKKVFKDAQVETVVICIKKTNPSNTELVYIDKDSTENTTATIPQIQLGEDSISFSVQKESTDIFKKIEKDSKELSALIDFKYGFKTADDEKFLTLEAKDSEYKKILRRSDFGRYKIEFRGEYINYRPELMRQNKNTARPGEKERFEVEKIIIMDISKKIVATLDKEKYYIKDALLLIKKTEKNSADLRYITGLINSKLINFYYKKKYEVISVAKNAILKIPIKICGAETQKEVIKRVENIIIRNSELQTKLNNTLEMLRHELGLEKINKKLECFYNLSVDEFISLSKKDFSIDKKQELISYFNKSKEEVLNLKNEINRIDNEIDMLVYKIYNLDEKDIQTITKSI